MQQLVTRPSISNSRGDVTPVTAMKSVSVHCLAYRVAKEIGNATRHLAFLAKLDHGSLSGASDSGGVRATLGEVQATCPLKLSGRQEERTPKIFRRYGKCDVGNSGVRKAGATARSSPAARIAGLREITGETQVTGSAHFKPRHPHPSEHNPTDMDMPAVSGPEIL
jgi:hypothetical protein